jgi:hypothetical protein
MHKSRCRICRRIANLLENPYNECDSFDTMVYEASMPGSRYPGRLVAGVSRWTIIDSKLPLKSIRSDYVDFELVKKWSAVCNASHSNLCATENAQELESLKLIDCECRVVRLAPPGHAFLALS